MALNGGAPQRGSAAAAAANLRRRRTGGTGGASGGTAGNMLQFYTDDAPGLKISPNVVLVMSIGFIAFVAVLHVVVGGNLVAMNIVGKGISTQDHLLFLLLLFDAQTKNVFTLCWNRWSRNIKRKALKTISRMALNGGAPQRGSAAAAAANLRRRRTGGTGGASGGTAGNMLQFYTDDAPGLKISPNVVLVMSIGFIAFVAVLHGTSFYVHFAACIYYFLAAVNPYQERTWISSINVDGGELDLYTFSLFRCEIGNFVTVKGDARKKYGDDYQCPNVLMVCAKLRANDPFIFCKRGTKDIAKVMYHVKDVEVV
ncbi:protein transport protein Sec61 subunit beta [Artemisia annua]|uniref:Protein transport protein Sec61 subunit beta n=1 Tax=Artemisia annua TaxID=35608 RepID=A0A2U1NXK1_ARTAN|nr:protein transport protein Sec61 subunit beta [Artemisia annua]